MRVAPIKGEMPVRISLSKSRIIEADILEELAIDTSNLRQEILEQPAKIALWSVLSDFAETKVKMANKNVALSVGKGVVHEENIQKYLKACEHYDLIFSTKKALRYRSEVLIQLCNNPTRKHRILVDYKNKLLNIRAFSA